MNYLAWFNVFLLIYLALFPLVIEANKRIFKGKNKNFNKTLKYGRKIHPIAGLVLITTGIIHGLIMLDGNLVFHTGLLVTLLLVINAIIGFTFKKTRNRKLAFVHRVIGVLIIVSFLLHYLNPWYFSSF